jgi:DNA-binding MarR family transcriptional regulator
MATTVSDLQALGYVRADQDPSDGRKRVLSLTADGRSALHDDRRGRVKRLADAIEGTLSDEEMRALARALALLEQVTAPLSGSTSRPGRPPITGDW